jgi:hypothetical protein
MRRAAFLLVFVLSGALSVSACGKGGYASTAAHAPLTTTTTTTTTTPGATTSHPPAPNQSPTTHAHALAFARAVNLTAADVPGFTAAPAQHSESESEQRLEQELRRCGAAQGSRGSRGSEGSQDAIVEAGSPNFELRRGILDLSVRSEVSVAQSPAQAAGSLSAIRSPRVRACVSRDLGQLLKSQHYGGATVTGVSIASGTPPAPGTAGGFGWRVTATLAVRGIRVDFYIDILGFVDGPAQVTLTSSGALRPFPAAPQEQLFSLLLARAKAHSP